MREARKSLRKQMVTGSTKANAASTRVRFMEPGSKEMSQQTDGHWSTETCISERLSVSAS